MLAQLLELGGAMVRDIWYVLSFCDRFLTDFRVEKRFWVREI